MKGKWKQHCSRLCPLSELRITTVSMCVLCVVLVAAKLLWIHEQQRRRKLWKTSRPAVARSEEHGKNNELLQSSSFFISLFFFPRCCWIPLPVRPPHPSCTTGGAQRCYANGAVSQKSNGAINYIYISFATSPLLLLLLLLPSFFIPPSTPPPCTVCRA